MIFKNNDALLYILNYSEYFSADEIVCRCGCDTIMVHPGLIAKIDMFRERTGKPVRINSGYRCEKHNKKIGGKKNSSHLKGLAVDIHMEKKDQKKFRPIIRTLFNRIGWGANFIHLDIDETKPACEWIY